MGWSVDLDWTAPKHPPTATWDGARRGWVAFDGYIANHAEVAAALGIEGPIPGDETLAAEALARWGEGAPCRLAGAFALASWDERRRALLAAADPLGVKSVVYQARGSRLGLATSTRELRRLSWIDAGVDDQAVALFLCGGHLASDTTYYRNLRRLPAGHLLRATGSRLDTRMDWGPPFDVPAGIRTTADLLERFRELFVQVVAESLPIDRPGVVLLSGGFDSTSVAYAAAEAIRRSGGRLASPTLHSWAFPGLACDESERVRIAQAGLDFDATLRPGSMAALTAEQMSHSAAVHDGPYLNLQQALFDEFAGSYGDRSRAVTLTGLGGDELCVDWHFEVDLLRRSGILGWIPALRTIARMDGVSTRRALATVAGRFGWQSPRTIWRRVAPRARAADERPEAWCRPEVKRLASKAGRGDRHGKAPDWPTHSGKVRWQVTSAAATYEARRWWDLELTSGGLALRAPFLDRRLWELVLGADALLPRSFDEGRYKPLISHGLASLVPSRLTSTYWKVVFDQYEHGILERTLPALRECLLSSGEWRAAAFIRREKARELLISTEAALTGNPSCRMDTSLLLRVAGLEIWLRHQHRKHPSSAKSA